MEQPRIKLGAVIVGAAVTVANKASSETRAHLPRSSRKRKFPKMTKSPGPACGPVCVPPLQHGPDK